MRSRRFQGRAGATARGCLGTGLLRPEQRQRALDPFCAAKDEKVTSAAPIATALGTPRLPAQRHDQSISPIVCDTGTLRHKTAASPLLPLRPAQQSPHGNCRPAAAQVSIG